MVHATHKCLSGGRWASTDTLRALLSSQACSHPPASHTLPHTLAPTESLVHPGGRQEAVRGGSQGAGGGAPAALCHRCALP